MFLLSFAPASEQVTLVSRFNHTMQITSVVAALFLLATVALVSSSDPANTLQLQVTNGTPFLMRVLGVNQTARNAQWVFPDNPNFQAKQSIQIVGAVGDGNANRGVLFAVLNFVIAFGDEIYPFTMLIDDRVQAHVGSSIFAVSDEKLDSTNTVHHNDVVGAFDLMYTGANVTITIKPQ